MPSRVLSETERDRDHGQAEVIYYFGHLHGLLGETGPQIRRWRPLTVRGSTPALLAGWSGGVAADGATREASDGT